EQELGSDCTDIRLVRVPHKFAQPCGISHQGIIIQEDQDFASTCLRAKIANFGKIEGEGISQHADGRVVGEAIQVLQHGGLARVVVYQNNLDQVEVVGCLL